MSDTRPAPYPADTRAKGWRFEIDYEQVQQSDTWALAAPSIRPWLLMLWTTAWAQTPCGSLPSDDDLIAARIGMDSKTFAKNRAVLLRGWWRADDGRLYHDTLADRVAAMLHKKEKDRARKAAWRNGQSKVNPQESESVTPESNVSPPSVPRDSDRKDDTKHQAPSTISSEPTVLKKKARERAVAVEVVAVSALVDAGMDEQTASEFMAHKQRVKAPLTPRSWADHLCESAKAGWTPQQAAEKVMAKGWKGFEAKYVAAQPSGVAIPINRQEAIEQRNRAAGEAWLREQGVA